MQRREKQHVICHVAAASFSNNGDNISSKMQNERWMGTGRSINIVKNTPENPRNLAENPLENPGKEFHFTVGHPGLPLLANSTDFAQGGDA